MERAFHLENIFAVQCRLVGADYNKIDRTKKEWYTEYEWDQEVDTRFRDWFADYIHKLPESQWELYQQRCMRKEDCVKAADMFLLNYGWKLKR